MAEVTNKYGYIVDYDEYLNELLIYNQTVFPNNVHYDVMVYGTIYEVYDSSVIIPVTPPEPPPASYTLPVVRLNPIPDSVGDISLIPDEAGDGDFVFLEGDISCDASLQTAVYISLFTDAPYEDDNYETRGWFGDTLDEYGVLGSKLWTLTRNKIDNSISELAKQYCEEALNWLITEGVSDSVVVTVSRSDINSLSIEVKISRPNDKDEYYKFAYNWEAQEYKSY